MSYESPTGSDTRFFMSWGCWSIVIVAILVVAAVIVSVAAGWVVLPFQQGSVANVQTQFAKGYDLYNSLKSTAGQVCNAQKAVNSATTDDERSQRESQLLGYQNNYNRLEADYDAWASNVFQGKVVRPADLPAQAPTLTTMSAQVCGS